MAVVKFSKKSSHQIYRLKDGSQVAGASTIAKMGESMDFLLSWYHKLGQDGKDPKKVVEEAGSMGTVCHGLVQCYFQGNEGNFDEFSKAEIEKGTQMFEKFKKVWAEQNLQWLASEVVLVSEEYRYGGTLDLIAYNKDGDLTLADVKTSPRIYGHMLRQIAGYEYLWCEHHPDDRIQKRVIIRLDKKKPELTDVRWLGSMEPHWEIFKKQVALYNQFRETE